MQVHICMIPHEYVNKDGSCTFYHSHCSDHSFVLERLQVLIREDTQFTVSFFRGTLGYSAAQHQETGLKAIQYLYIFGSRIITLGLLRSVLLRTESLLVVGDDATIFQIATKCSTPD